MPIPPDVLYGTPDPIVGAIQLGYPIGADVITRAIRYRESVIDQVRDEIVILQRAQARLGQAPLVLASEP